ncbi:MAG: hypothetical protein HXY34_13090 [Candidatus Thorarchaeota archaeon]|nr:hypothetical protein [Candidatus Thorarchaeota archaeon]
MMKRLLVFLVLVTVAVPASILLQGMYLTSSDAGASTMDQDERHVTDNVSPDLSMMFFAEAAPNSDGVRYVCRRGVDVVAYFGESQVYYVVGDTLVRLCLPGSRPVVPRGEEPTGSVTNYLLSNDPALWRTGLVDCAVLRYSEVYPGVDLVYRIHDGALKYEFVVAPHADPTAIRMHYPDADNVELGADSVTVTVDRVTLTDSGLYAYQTCEDCETVDCSFNVLEHNSVGFSVAEYDHSHTLTVDPMLAYSSFLGSTDSDVGYNIAVEDGYIYVTGHTMSSDFPTVSAYMNHRNRSNGSSVC